MLATASSYTTENYNRKVQVSNVGATVLIQPGASPFAASSYSTTSSAGVTPLSADTDNRLKVPSPSVTVPSQQQQKQHIDSSSLNTDQNAASEHIFLGGNTFITRAVGVGKSYLLCTSHLIQGLHDKYK